MRHALTLWNHPVGTERIVEDFFRGFPVLTGRPLASVAGIPGIREFEKEYSLRVALPGVPKDKIAVETTDGTLRVSGKEESTESEYDYSWMLPEDVDQENIGAEWKDGILFLKLPKLVSQPNTRRIEIRNAS